jgi:hypothetical protein
VVANMGDEKAQREDGGLPLTNANGCQKDEEYIECGAA